MRHKVILVRDEKEQKDLVRLLDEGWTIISAVAHHCTGGGYYTTAPIQYVLRREE